MKFSAIQKLTLLDFPEHVAAIAFTAGCNLRCHYCHNAEFVLPERLRKIRGDFIPAANLLAFLRTRRGLLDGVVISGGEPTIHAALPAVIREIKALGFAVKLDTNGSNPAMLAELLRDGLLDYVALDIKASPARSAACGGVDSPAPRATRDLLLRSDIDYELRTTLVKEFHDDAQLNKLVTFVAGAKKYVLQNFRSTAGCLNPAWEKYHGFGDDELQAIAERVRATGVICEVR